MAWKRDQTTRTIPGQTLTTDSGGTAIQVSTNYWVSYDFNQATHVAWLNYNDFVQAVGRGQMRVGFVSTISETIGLYPPLYLVACIFAGAYSEYSVESEKSACHKAWIN